MHLYTNQHSQLTYTRATLICKLEQKQMIIVITAQEPDELIHTQISNLVRKMRFWNNVHQVRSKSKDYKDK